MKGIRRASVSTTSNPSAPPHLELLLLHQLPVVAPHAHAAVHRVPLQVVELVHVNAAARGGTARGRTGTWHMARAGGAWPGAR